MKRKRLWFFVFGAIFGIALSAGVNRFYRYATQMRLGISVQNETPYEFKMMLHIDEQYLRFVIPAKTAEPYLYFKNEEHRVRYTLPLGATMDLENDEKKFRLYKCLNVGDYDEPILDMGREIQKGLHSELAVSVSFIISETETGEIIVSPMSAP